MKQSPSPSIHNGSAYERLGGEGVLRVIVADFIDRVLSDMMIGFHFKGVDPDRLKELEFQFASRHLGGPHQYEGRTLPDAHGKHAIMGGQFNRRLKLLARTLEDHQVEEDVRRIWIDHNEKLRAQITRDASGECNDARALSSSTPKEDEET